MRQASALRALSSCSPLPEDVGGTAQSAGLNCSDCRRGTTGSSRTMVERMMGREVVVASGLEVADEEYESRGGNAMSDALVRSGAMRGGSECESGFEMLRPFAVERLVEERLRLVLSIDLRKLGRRSRGLRPAAPFSISLDAVDSSLMRHSSPPSGGVGIPRSELLAKGSSVGRMESRCCCCRRVAQATSGGAGSGAKMGRVDVR